MDKYHIPAIEILAQLRKEYWSTNTSLKQWEKWLKIGNIERQLVKEVQFSEAIERGDLDNIQVGNYRGEIITVIEVKEQLLKVLKR